MKSKRRTSPRRTSPRRTSPRRTSPRRTSPRRNRISNSRSRRGKNRRKRANSKNKNKYDGSVEQIPMTSRCYLIVENRSPHNFRAIDIYHGIFIRIDNDNGEWIFKIVKKYQGPINVTEGATKSFDKNDCIFIYDGQYTLELYSEQESEDLGLETASNDAINEFLSASAIDPNVVIIGQHMNPY